MDANSTGLRGLLDVVKSNRLMSTGMIGFLLLMAVMAVIDSGISMMPLILATCAVGTAAVFFWQAGSYRVDIYENGLEIFGGVLTRAGIYLYKDIESIQYYTELTDAGLMEPDYMMKCLMLRSRDNARTPMQWDDSKQAGFTDGEPWIKVNPNYKEINAAQQLEDPNSIFHYYQKLIRLRKEKDIIVYGGFEPLYRDDEQIFAYTRKQDQEKLLTVCNFSDQNAEVEVPEEFKDAECLITNLGRKVFEAKTVLKPYEAFVLYKK